MRRSLLLILLSGLWHACVSQSDFNIGFKGGVGYSGWKAGGNNQAIHDFTGAKSLGIFATYKLPYRLRAHVEAAFFQTGSVYKNSSAIPGTIPGTPASPTEVRYKVSRVYSPVKLSYDLVKGKVTPYAGLGFGPAFVQHGSRSYRSSQSPAEQTEDLDLEAYYNKQLEMDFPVIATIGIRAFERLSVEASLIMGEKFYYRFQPDDAVCYEGCPAPELSYNNRVIMFAAAYSFLP